MKTVGIIGGLGPETTTKLYLEIVTSCLKNKKNQRPPILIWSVPIPIKVEEELITKDIGAENFLPFLIDGAKTLEKAGADFLVMPCNTMHIFIEDIRDAVNIPVLSIIDEIIEIIKKRKKSELGILATSTTINRNLFSNKLKINGINLVVPTNKDQFKLDKIIHNLVLGRQSLDDGVQANKIVTKMAKQRIENIILACTDLQLIIKKRSEVRIFDTMQILADATVRKIN